MTRHKHADLMIAYANDTSIQMQIRDNSSDEWEDIAKGFEPTFHSTVEYRIKPKEAVKGDLICEIDGVKCCLVPREINSMLVSHKQGRGMFPIGVHYKKKVNKYVAKVSINGSTKFCGLFDTPEEAFLSYKENKERNIKQKAVEYKAVLIDRCFQSLMNWEIKITD